MNRSLLRTKAFVRAVRRYLKKHSQAAQDMESALLLLASDAFDPRLKTHRLKGDLEGLWACSAGYDLRIVFQIVEEGGTEAILLLTVGTHEEVY